MVWPFTTGNSDADVATPIDPIDLMGGVGPKSKTPLARGSYGPIERPSDYATPVARRSAARRPRKPRKPRQPSTSACKAVRAAKRCPKKGDIRGKRANKRFPVTVYVMHRYLKSAKIPATEIRKAFPHGISAAKRPQLLAYFRKHPRRCERLFRFGKRVCI